MYANRCLIAQLHFGIEIFSYLDTKMQISCYIVTCVTTFVYNLTCGCARKWQPKFEVMGSITGQLPLGILGHLRLDPELQPNHGRRLHFGAVAVVDLGVIHGLLCGF